jgi:hypothetical protein
VDRELLDPVDDDWSRQADDAMLVVAMISVPDPWIAGQSRSTFR